ncbi:MAG: DUF2148 domain-containing protein [Candidatus Nezhaarchaeales archaeon]
MDVETPTYKHSELVTIINLITIVAKSALSAKSIETKLVDGEQKEELAKYMNQLAEELRDPSYKAEIEDVRLADVVMLVGLKDGGEIAKMNCGACGFPTCEDMLKNRREGLLFPGPTCIIRALDLGATVDYITKLCISLGIKAKASLKVGVAAKRLGYFKCDVIVGALLTTKKSRT